MNPTISLLDVLYKIGFQEGENGLQYDFGNCQLEAIESMNLQFMTGICFFGNYKTDREIGSYDFIIPSYVESFEQGLALLAHYLSRGDLVKTPDWLAWGLTLKEHLPWEQKKKAFRENPRAVIDHEWVRLMLKKLREQVDRSSDEDITTFAFNGNILHVTCNGMNYAIHGSGKEWHSVATLRTKSLIGLPKQVPRTDIEIFTWEGELYLCNRRFKLVG